MPATKSPPASKDLITQRNTRRQRFRLWLLLFITLGLAFLILNERLTGNPPHAQAQVRSSSTANPGTSQPGTDTAAAPTSSPNAAATTSSPSLSPSTPTGTGPTATLIAPQPGSFINDLYSEKGTIYFSLSEGGYSHLFAYHPQSLPFTRLTSGAWDDITPSASPDGTRLAFASNRGGHWDLHLMDLASGEITQITNTPEYDASPSWSPDSQWLVYESYMPLSEEEGSEAQLSQSTPSTPSVTDSLDLFIRPAMADDMAQQELIRLTNDPAVDYNPVWSPNGRQIAFVSNRSGDEEIWLADLDRIEDRFRNVSESPRSVDQFPAWSPDGNSLAWASSFDGFQNLYILDIDQPSSQALQVGNGSQPTWSPGGKYLFTALQTPNRTYLTGYQTDAPGLALPPVPLNGTLSGLSWSTHSLSVPLPEMIEKIAHLTPVPAWLAALTPAADVPASRQRVVPLQDVNAPYPYLHDLTDESFSNLRAVVAARIGWDFLSTLENAYIPLTTPLFPGMLDDWLYTGRAFTINPGPMNAGWMLVTREEYGGHTYWRVFLRTRYQDGTQGMPLHLIPWNFNARYSGDPRYYEQGGAIAQLMPPGYWVDLTSLADDYGWERLPALITWRSAMAAARFNELIFSDGLDWPSAMQELYPASALITPTPASPPTLTPTKTRWPTRTPTQTRTPRPSRTPGSTQTPTPQRFPTATNTPDKP